MPTLDSVSLESLFTMLKGEPGTRKSTCALSYPRPQYWFSTDQKMEALKLPAHRWGIDMKEIHFDDYSNWDKPLAKMRQLKLNCRFKTLIVDSVTSNGDNINLQVMRSKRSENLGKFIGGIQTSGLEEYNAEAAAFQEMMDILKDIHKFHNVNVVLIAHVVGQRKNDDANKLTHHSRVIITGGDKISGKIASKMTETYHFNVKTDFNADSGEGEYTLFTQHTGNDYARTALPLDKVIKFNNEPLYDKWIKPAIERQMKETPIVRTLPPTPSSSTPTTASDAFTGKVE